MSITVKEEARALDADEQALVADTHHPALRELADADLAALLRRVRERRDRAQALLRQRRREMRGKGTPRGARPAGAEDGSHTKAEVLAQAMRRLNGEAARRKRMSSRLKMIASQQRALEMVQAIDQPHGGFNTRTAHRGMQAVSNRKITRIGSAKEAGRVSQFVRSAQARRDSR